MIFREFEDIDEIDDLSFDSCPFWLHLLGIPIGLSIEKVARILWAKQVLC